MIFAGLAAEAWVAVAAVAGLTVLLCLGTIAKTLRYELRLQELISEVRDIRIMRGEIPPPPGRRVARRAPRQVVAPNEQSAGEPPMMAA